MVEARSVDSNHSQEICRQCLDALRCESFSWTSRRSEARPPVAEVEAWAASRNFAVVHIEESASFGANALTDRSALDLAHRARDPAESTLAQVEAPSSWAAVEKLRGAMPPPRSRIAWRSAFDPPGGRQA